MAGIIVLAIVFFVFKKSTLQASITKPDHKASNYFDQQIAIVDSISQNTYTEFADNSKVNWISFSEAYKKCKVNPKPVMIDVYTTWCGPCKMMSAETFNNPFISKYINEHFYAVKFDAETKDSVKFDKYIFVTSDNTNPKAPHQFATSILDNQLAFPSIVFLNNKLQRIDIIKGFMPPNEFDPVIQYYGSGVYQTSTWADFKNGFQTAVK